MVGNIICVSGRNGKKLSEIRNDSNVKVSIDDEGEWNRVTIYGDIYSCALISIAGTFNSIITATSLIYDRLHSSAYSVYSDVRRREFFECWDEIDEE